MPAPQPASTGGTDSVEARDFKLALATPTPASRSVAAAGVKPDLIPLDLHGVVDATLVAIDPKVTIPRYVLGTILLPAHIIGLIGETFTSRRWPTPSSTSRCTSRSSTDRPSCSCPTCT